MSCDWGGGLGQRGTEGEGLGWPWDPGAAQGWLGSGLGGVKTRSCRPSIRAHQGLFGEEASGERRSAG